MFCAGIFESAESRCGPKRKLADTKAKANSKAARLNRMASATKANAKK